ncbi:MAG: hypothetical protein IPL90_02345 [Holophagales bacterium]|nr:hypothetical protein [Holophagales bacterium]
MTGRLARVSLAAVLLTATAAIAAVDPARLEGLKARSIGPAGMSGRIAAIDAFAGDPRIVFVGAASGGVWKSTNGGLTFDPVFDEQPVHAIGALAVDPRTPDVVWVGTGEGNLRNSISHGDGVYVTRDGGKTWTNVGLAKTERIHRILLHPRDPGTAWACAVGPAWTDGPERGVFRTTDGGKSWKKVLHVDEKTGCADLALDPGNPDHLLAAMWDFRRTPYLFRSGGPGSGLHVTWDGGESWTKLGEKEGVPKGPLGRIGLAFCDGHPEVVYAVVEAEKSVLLRSENGGRRFEVVNDSPSANPRPFYYADIRVDPQQPNRVYSLATQLRVSTDGGKTFENLRGTGRQQVHVDHHALWIDPKDPRRMLLGNDGGMYESRDRGETFRFVGTLPLAQYYHVAVDGEIPYNVYGGLQDNNSWRGPSSVWQRGGIQAHHWKVVGGGDGFETLPDPEDPARGWSLSQGGNLMRWNVTTGERRDAKPQAPEGTKLRFNWNAALAVDPFEPATVWLGSQFVHRSKDRGETWETVSPDLTTNNPGWQKQETSGGLTLDVTAAENYTTLVTIAPSPAAKGTIWTGSDDGRIHVTRDGGATWTSVEKALPPGAPKNAHVAAIEPSRHDAATAFAVLDNHRWGDPAPYVYRTDDSGKSWKSLVTPAVKGYALAIVQDPVKKDLLFLGTETGLYASLDGGKGWLHLSKTIPTASVMDLVIHPTEGDLVIATHGRAIWILDDLTPFREMTEEALGKPLHLFAPVPARQHWRAPEDGVTGAGAADFAGTARPYGALLTFTLNAPGLPAAGEEEPPSARRGRGGRGGEGEDGADPSRPRISVRVTDAAGKLVRVFDAPARLGVSRVAWDLGRDAWRRFPRAADAGPLPEWLASGPEVPPGDYTVTLTFKDASASAKVAVLPDPRSKNTAADWAKRWAEIERAGELQEKAAEAAIRIRRTRDDVSALEERLRRRNETLRDPAERRKANETPFAKEAAALKKALTEKENLLWSPPEDAGIPARDRVAQDLQAAAGNLTSSWAPPSPTHLERLRQAEARLAKYLADLDAFWAKDVDAFREKAAKEGVGLLAP